MLRYFHEAFWARPRIPGLGRVPVNALLVAGLGILGLGHEAFWLVGAGLETAYLAALVTNQRFRKWVDAIKFAENDSCELSESQTLVSTLSKERKDRHRALALTVEETFRYYRKSEVGQVLAETNRAALEQLSLFHLKLLAAQQGLEDLNASTNEAALRREIELVHGELCSDKITSTLRTSKQATLSILEKRLGNLERLSQSLAEIEGDLKRIEAQVELARENAGMGSQPEAISPNIHLASRLLDEVSWSVGPQTQ